MTVSSVFSDPTKGRGFLAYAALGAGGAIVACLVGILFPNLIPTRAASTTL